MNAILRPADSELAPVPVTSEAFEVLLGTSLFADQPDKIELIDGVIVMAPPPGREHARTSLNAVMALARVLVLQGLDGAWGVLPEGGMVVDPVSRLVPDLAIMPRDPSGDFAATGALVVIEIAWSSFARDTGLKARKYAAAGVREYWVLDVAAKAVIVHTGPASGPDVAGWAQVRTVEAGASLSPVGEPRLQVAVADLF
jgi:Uma2 family endonuclease